TRSDVPPLDTVERAVQFALRVRDVIAAQVSDGLLPSGAVVSQGRSVAGLLQRAGRTDEAVAQLRAIGDLADDGLREETDDSGRVRLQALIDLGALAENTRRRDLAQYVLDKLDT